MITTLRITAQAARSCEISFGVQLPSGGSDDSLNESFSDSLHADILENQECRDEEDSGIS
jgi:hypothetical protein